MSLIAVPSVRVENPRWLFRVTLPWPPKTLSPNARVFWMKRSLDTKRFRRAVAVAVAKLPRPDLPDGPLLLDWTFCPPDLRRRDLDNVLGALKAATDGLTMGTWRPVAGCPDGLYGLGIDDSRFAETRLRMGAPVKWGAVVARIAALPAQETPETSKAATRAALPADDAEELLDGLDVESPGAAPAAEHGETVPGDRRAPDAV